MSIYCVPGDGLNVVRTLSYIRTKLSDKLMAGAQYIHRQVGWVPRSGALGHRLRSVEDWRTEGKGHRKNMESQLCLPDLCHCPQISIHLDTNSSLRLEETKDFKWKLPSFLLPNRHIHQHLLLPQAQRRGCLCPRPKYGVHLCSRPHPSAAPGTVALIAPCLDPPNLQPLFL